MKRTTAIAALLTFLTPTSALAHGGSHPPPAAPKPARPEASRRPMVHAAASHVPHRAEVLRDEWRTWIYEQDYNGLRLFGGEFALRERPELAASIYAFNLGRIRVERIFVLRRTSVRLRLTGQVTASLAHATRSRYRLVRDELMAPTWCAVQSDATVEGEISFGRSAHLSLGATLRGDPFHFTTGQGCLGDPNIWQDGARFGVALTIDVMAWLTVSARFAARKSRLSYELGPDDATARYGTIRSSETLALLALEVKT
jgi:hypothetical protein